MKEFKAKMVSYEDLPDEIKNTDLSNNGNGAKYATYILIWHGDELLGCYSDAMEPEDTVFYRDLDWIPGAIERAYECGKTDQKLYYLEKEKEKYGTSRSNMEKS